VIPRGERSNTPSQMSRDCVSLRFLKIIMAHELMIRRRKVFGEIVSPVALAGCPV
jgi:hypothetical protein